MHIGETESLTSSYLSTPRSRNSLLMGLPLWSFCLEKWSCSYPLLSGWSGFLSYRDGPATNWIGSATLSSPASANRLGWEIVSPRPRRELRSTPKSALSLNERLPLMILTHWTVLHLFFHLLSIYIALLMSTGLYILWLCMTSLVLVSGWSPC